jgi:hypothetical protein
MWWCSGFTIWLVYLGFSFYTFYNLSIMPWIPHVVSMYIDKAASLVSPTCLCANFNRRQLFIKKSQNYQIPVRGCYATLLNGRKTRWLQTRLAYYFYKKNRNVESHDGDKWLNICGFQWLMPCISMSASLLHRGNMMYFSWILLPLYVLPIC